MAKKRTAYNITERFDESVEKFANTIGHLTTGIALHTQRLDTIDDSFKSLESKQEIHMAKAEDDYRELNNKIEATAKEVTGHFDAVVAKWKEDQAKVDENLSKRVGRLERWRWMILGGVAVLVVVFEIIKMIATSNFLPYILNLTKL